MKLSPLPVVVFSLALLAAPSEAQSTTLISQSSLGVQGLRKSNSPSVSAFGRFVSFESEVRTLVPGDTNGAQDIFLHDLVTAQTVRVSVASNGAESDGTSWLPQLSSDGRFIVFQSAATNLVPGDTNGQIDVFVHDRIQGTTVRANLNSAGKQALAFGSGAPSVSGDGHLVAFSSRGHNFVSGDTNRESDIFLHDMVSGATTRVSVSSSGAEATGGGSSAPWLSEDGRFVAFVSTATDLVPDDTNGRMDVFLHDTVRGTTARADVSSTGAEAPLGGWNASVSANGRFVALKSPSTNLVPEDLNGQDLDIFLYDAMTGVARLVSVNSSGIQANGFSSRPSISPDGGFISFYSAASNLIPEDRNKRNWDVFLHALPRVRDL